MQYRTGLYRIRPHYNELYHFHRNTPDYTTLYEHRIITHYTRLYGIGQNYRGLNHIIDNFTELHYIIQDNKRLYHIIPN
jgi:hypothetical protein